MESRLNPVKNPHFQSEIPMTSPHDIDFSSTQVAAYNMALAAHPSS